MRKQKRILFGFFLIFALINLLIPSKTIGEENKKLYVLENRMRKIDIFLEKISDRQLKATELKQFLRDKSTGVVEEIRQKLKKENIKSYKEAIQYPRIQYDLILIRKIKAYETLLDRRMDILQSGKDNLKFFYDQARDDIKMIKALSDIDVSSLLAQIDQLLKQYSNITDQALMDVHKISLMPASAVWKHIMGAHPQPKKR